MWGDHCNHCNHCNHSKKTQLQPPFGPSVDSLCHPCITTTHLSYSVLSLKLPPPPCAVPLVSNLLFYMTLWASAHDFTMAINASLNALEMHWPLWKWLDALQFECKMGAGKSRNMRECLGNKELAVQLCNYTYLDLHHPTPSNTVPKVWRGEKQGESQQLFGGAALFLLASQFANCSSAWSARFAGWFFRTLGPCHCAALQLLQLFHHFLYLLAMWHWKCQVKRANNPMITVQGVVCPAFWELLSPDALDWFRSGNMSSIIQRSKKH